MHIKLDRCILRKPEPYDVDALYNFRNDLSITSQLGGFSRGFTKTDLLEWVEHHRKNEKGFLWVITDFEDKCIGHVGLYQIDLRLGIAEFAICFDRASQGMGLGKLVANAVIDYGFMELNLRRIHISILASNKASIRMCEGVGFKMEGTLREAEYRAGEYVDVHIMGLLKHEWNQTFG